MRAFRRVARYSLVSIATLWAFLPPLLQLGGGPGVSAGPRFEVSQQSVAAASATRPKPKAARSRRPRRPPRPTVSRQGFMWPHHDIITSRYGKRRRGYHHGIDILCRRGGERIRAARNGRVILSRTVPVYGKAVVVRHSGGSRTLYAHLKTRNVRRGERVDRGEVIGRCGSTGHSTAPHLHFEVYGSKGTINPRRVLPRRGT